MEEQSPSKRLDEGSSPFWDILVASYQFDTTIIMILTGIIWGIRQMGKAAVMSGLE